MRLRFHVSFHGVTEHWSSTETNSSYACGSCKPQLWRLLRKLHKRPFLGRIKMQTFFVRKIFCSYSLRRDVREKLVFVTLLILNQSLSYWTILPTFRRKVCFGFHRRSTVGVNFLDVFRWGDYEKIILTNIYTHFFVPHCLEGVINQSSWNFSILW